MSEGTQAAEKVTLADHRIMNARHGQVACFCDPDWMTLDEYADHIEHVAAIVEREHRDAELALIDAAGITWQSRARRLAERLRQAVEAEAEVDDFDYTTADARARKWIAFPGKVPVCQDCGTDWNPVQRGQCSRCGSDAGPLRNPPGSRGEDTPR